MEAQPGIPCPSCGHNNRADRRFCTECGGRLGRTCAACGTAVEPIEKFCGNCGASLGVAVPAERAPATYTPRHLAEKILTSRAALEGERKQVTVLFADVKGSMELAERVDPEAWHRIMDRFFALLAEGVHRFEGTVNQFTGDGIMALFGAPIAHEDHARRACYAALHLTGELRRYANELRLREGFNFAVRMGLNSGEVVVGRIGDDLRMDYTAQGHTVGLAARMEQIAEPGKVYVTEHTAALVEGFFQLGDLGEMEVKGVHAPLQVYELCGVGPLRTRLDVSRARGFSRFVGRADEMQVLEAALARANQGQGQILGVVGEAGVGKSRLCAEFLERCRARGLMTYDAQGVAHGKAVPFLPVLDLCRKFFGVTELDSGATARERIAGRLLLLDDAFRASLPVVFDFLGVPDSEHPAPRLEPEARERQLFAVVRGVTQARGQRETTVTLLEDLHWFDAGSEAFVEAMVEAAPATRGLLLLNFRPEYRAGWMQRSNYQQLPVRPLGPDAIRQLLEDLLGTDPSLAALAEAIQARTVGNPFFTEEVVRSLVDSGKIEGTRGHYCLVAPVETLEVPATVESILAARIDRLPEREKGVLQAAAVIGQEFTEPLLAAVVARPAADLTEALRTLTSAEFVYEEALYPVAEYAFKHPLTREVAYRAQLTARRQETHAAVARTLAAQSAEKLDERAALLAHHWERAGEALEAARWHRRAAMWTAGNHSAEALRHWRRVRELACAAAPSAETATLGTQACAGIMLFGIRLGLPQAEVDALFAEAQELGRRSGDVRAVVEVWRAYGAFRLFSGAVDESLGPLADAVRLAESTGDLGLRVSVRFGLVLAHTFAGRLADGLAVIDETLRLGAGDLRLGVGIQGVSFSAVLLGFRCMILSWMGRSQEGAPDVERALRHGHEHGELTVLHQAHAAASVREVTTGDVQGALTHARQAVDLAERMESALQLVIGYMTLGSALVACKDWSGATRALEHALAIARDRRAVLVVEGNILASLAEARLGSGDRVQALKLAREAVAVGRRCGTRVNECAGHLALARALLATDGAKARNEVEHALGEALRLVEETGARSYTPEICVERAELARLSGDAAARQRELREAHRLFTEMGATARAEQVARELGSSTESTSGISSTSRT